MSAHRRIPEILAPAGDRESLEAALRSGADAVYFGLDSGFNARARAANFPPEGLKETVLHCHRAGAKVYLTLNTLVFESELPECAAIIALAAGAGVDALIVQDPAVAILAGRLAPGLELHASTQMTVSSADGVRFAETLGIRRVVVPRELSVHEIRRLRAATEMELEVFVHGALCVSWSGQCLTSEAWSGRSANRGQCNQACRMPYDLLLDGARVELGDLRYLLSPKDLAGMRALPELCEIGVHGLKIEGRQKGPQYVATATSGYRRLLDAIADEKVSTASATTDAAADLRDMTLSYSRGFSDGFLGGSDHQTLVEGRFPKHRGAYLGRVRRVQGREVLVDLDPGGRPWTGKSALPESEREGPRGRPNAALSGMGGRDDASSGPAAAEIEVVPGMGLVFDAGNPEDKSEPGGPVFRVERRGSTLILGFGNPGPDLARVLRGHRVWVTSDPRLGVATRHLLETGTASGRNPIRLRVSGAPGEPLRVLARTDRDEEARVESGMALVPAKGAGLDLATLEEKLGAFGGSPFRCAAIDAEALHPGLFVPVSELKRMRRELVEALEARLAARHHEVLPLPEVAPRRKAGDSQMGAAPPAELIVLCRSDAQLEAVLESGLGAVELDWMEVQGLARAAARARDAGLEVTIASLRVQKPGEDGFGSALERCEPDGILVRHWGALMRFRRGGDAGARPRLHGDFSLNVTNSITAERLFEMGLDTLTPSHDLDETQLSDLLLALPPERVTVVAQHRIATFHTEHCVYAHLLSEGRDFHTCGRPCESHELALRDHVGRDHPVIVDAGCRNTVFNAEKQSLARLLPGLRARGLRRFRIELVREGKAETLRTIAAWRDLLEGRTTPQELNARLRLRDQVGLIAAT